MTISTPIGKYIKILQNTIIDEAHAHSFFSKIYKLVDVETLLVLFLKLLVVLVHVFLIPFRNDDESQLNINSVIGMQQI